MTREYIAYAGLKFTVEWYYDEKEKSQSLDYFEGLDKDLQRKLLALFQLMGDFGQIKNKEKFNFEGDQIYAFKPLPHRFLCFFFTGRKIVVTNAFIKKRKKLSRTEKARALNFKRDYEIRAEEGDYYE
ncbi:type II toxin-antitoxin system RelE/ParE family toxin [Simkania negevensis]|uniref:Type II toxin-antitoxin system RelE/ParE family toxin n=1 Tax=Simkania negevensis TaxID=83561 RepID=A0ABS3AQB0_9BACT|nr:type II toxin-antitoxin system RelE/ParE family toxin [Simkania negevensis]